MANSLAGTEDALTVNRSMVTSALMHVLDRAQAALGKRYR